LECHQMDIDTAFLNGELEEEIYMKQPQGLEEPGQEHLVCRLLRSLYGLKQAPRAWYKTFTDFLKAHGFVMLSSDACVYIKKMADDILIVGIYVDDLLLLAKTPSHIAYLKSLIGSRFKSKDLGDIHYILGVQVKRDRASRRLFMHQSKYAKSILEKFNFEQARAQQTPGDSSVQLSKKDSPQTEEDKQQMQDKDYRGLVGSLMYLMLGTRPDIAYSLQACSKFLSNPGQAHWIAAKRILRYLKGTLDYGLVFDGNVPDASHLTAYIDSDYGNCLDTRRSVSGYIMQLGGCAVTYSSKTQPTVALSSTEAEYMALAHGVKEVLFLRQLLHELHRVQPTTAIVYGDNQSSIAMAKNPVHHQRTKHIDVRYHFVRERVGRKDIAIEYVDTKSNMADLLTKNVSREILLRLRSSLGVRRIEQ
jgi:hypothetical protein